MRIFVITAVHLENNELSRVRGYMSSVNLSLFFPPFQFPVEFNRNEIINLIRQGNIFDAQNKEGVKVPLHLNDSKNTVNLKISQFNNVENF